MAIHSVTIHEDILRHLWSKQYLDADRLTTLDGRTLKIISPGILNRGGGPDFHDGVIILDGQTFRGDIEFHRTNDDWNIHLHNNDQKYNSVILHVVLHGNPGAGSTTSASGRLIPVLAIDEFLSFPLEKIIEHAMRDEHISRSAPLRCFDHNNMVGVDILEQWIQKLYGERLKEKAVHMFGRLVEIIDEQHRGISEPAENYRAWRGEENPDEIPAPETHVGEKELHRVDAWEQLLYEGFMDGLGYSKNRIPFATLANRVSVRILKSSFVSYELTALELEAILFRVSGLLPEMQLTHDQQSKIHLHQLHTAWKNLHARPRITQLHSIESMHPTEWMFSPTRPANFPTARIAAASFLLERILYRQMLTHIVTIVEGAHSSPQEKLEHLLTILTIGEDPFWSFHYSFTESSPRRHAILGDARKYDLVINTILPLCSLNAVIFQTENLHEQAMKIAAVIPLLEANFITRRMEKQLLKEKLRLRSAYQQQGIIQLYKRYCRTGRCSECEVGAAVFQK
ncbi:MAG: DUF2851 family protein [Bacteroidota bacterium]